MKKVLQFIAEKLFLLKIYLFGQSVYTNCDELPKWNFDKIVETKDFRFLIAGSEFGKKTQAPENAAEIWEQIREEYAEKTGNDKLLIYFGMLSDMSDMENRAYFGQTLLHQLATRGDTMTATARKGYIEELRAFRFYLNEGKPFAEEVERLIRQLKSVKTKLEAKAKEVQDFEEKYLKGEEVGTIELKVRIQRILGVNNIDLKAISVTEWLQWIKEAIENGKKQL